jgi:preprotein translocase subunit SecE
MVKNKVAKKQEEAPLPDRVRTYIDGVMREVRLVTWPNREQVRATTMVVLITVFAFAVFFGVVDYVLAIAQRSIYK